MEGCPSCGLFTKHVDGCRGVIAVYWQYGNRGENDGFMTARDALDFLIFGEDAGSLSSDSIVTADGTVLMTSDQITDAYVRGPSRG